MKLLFLNSVLIVAFSVLRAQVFNLVKDINSSGDGNPENLFVFNDKLFFSAVDSNGQQLWVTDGTESGTFPIHSSAPSSTTPGVYCIFNGKLFYSISGFGTGGLWSTDGTIANTHEILDSNLNSIVNASFLTELNGKLYFSAWDSIHAYELWVSDGTSNGTYMLKDINPSGGSSVTGLMAFNSKLYFAAGTSTYGNELWSSDGTTAGTQLVKDINPSGNSNPGPFIEYNGKLYFVAYEDQFGIELWRTDGTTAGTVLFKDIKSGASGSLPSEFIVFNGKLFFSAYSSAGNELWRTDGTSGGTQMVKDINPSGDAFPSEFCEWSGKLYFSAIDGVHYAELWVTDGTAANTYLVVDINPGGYSAPKYLTVYHNKLYFKATEYLGSKNLYVTDGTVLGTQKLTPSFMTGGSLLGGTFEIVTTNNLMFFGAEYLSPVGEELYSFSDLSIDISFYVPACDSNDGWISISAANGLPPYTFSLDSLQQTNATFSGLSGQNSYSVCVIDSHGSSACLDFYLPDSCDLVWPGDANDDLIADNLDILAITVGNNTNGHSRAVQGTNWVGYPVQSWSDTLPGGGNYKHIDCDGDGSIKLSDTLAVVQNYNLTRPTSKTSPGKRQDASALKIVAASDTLTPGETGSLLIHLGDVNQPAIDVYGIAFTLEFNPSVVNTASISINTINSWLDTSGNNLISVALNNHTGIIKGAISRYDHIQQTGSGNIALVNFSINPTISGSYLLPFSLTDVVMTDNSGVFSYLNAQSDTIYIEAPLTDKSMPFYSQISIYPNPASEQIILKHSQPFSDLQFTIFDLEGRKILYGNNVNEDVFKIDVCSLASGLYFLQLVSEDYTEVFKVFVDRH